MSEITSPILLDETGKRMAAALEAIAMNGAGGAIAAQNWKGVQNLVRTGMGRKAFPEGTQFEVHKESSLTATMGVHTGITAVTVNEETFLASEGIVGSGVHEFRYDGGAWIYVDGPVRLADYGLTVTGTAAEGDEIIVTEAFDTIIFDVVDHRDVVDPADGETKPGMVLMMHDVIYGRQFDAVEAVYYTEDGLEAGDYCFTVKNQAWYADDNDKVYYFHLDHAVPAGGQLVLAATYNQTLEGKNIRSYSGPTSTTIIDEAALSQEEIDDATSLGQTDGTGNMNHLHRALLGSNNYAESAIRQWINSNAAANAWWKSMNNFDRPSSNANIAGMLHGMDSDFLAVVRTVQVPCKTNNTFELPGWTKNTAYTLNDRFFLASINEVGFATESGIPEGTVFGAYDGAANVDRIKYDMANKSTARYWWLRSPNPSYATNARRVNTSGALSNYIAHSAYGVGAACVIF